MVKIYLDTANISEMANSKVDGFTTNHSLMRAAGVTDYLPWAKEICSTYPTHEVSFEVIADDFAEMERQARVLAALGENVYVKIPVTNTKGESSCDLIKKLSVDGVKLNVTALFTRTQIRRVINAIKWKTPAIISVFAGRIGDTGVDPRINVRYAVKNAHKSGLRVLWASTRQALDVKFAEEAGADIITVGPEIYRRLKSYGKDLDQFSLETVCQFRDDAMDAGYVL